MTTEPIEPDQQSLYRKPFNRKSWSLALSEAATLFGFNRKRQNKLISEVFTPAKPWPGVVPDNVPQLAMDDFGSIQFANSYGTIGEGLGFIGYAVLAELAQRPEFRRFSEIFAEEMTRKFVRLVSASDEPQSMRIKILMDGFEKLRLKETFRKIAEVDALYGRANLYPDLGRISDEEKQTPLIVSKETIPLGALKGFKVVEPFWTYPAQYDLRDPTADDFYKPNKWYVMGTTYHASRMMPFVGRPVPDILKPAYSFGGMSMTQMVKPYVDNWIRTRQNVSELIETFSQQVLSTDMDATLAGDSAKALDDRVRLYLGAKSNRGVMVIDKEREDLKVVTSPLSELASLQAQAQEMMCAVAAVPLVKYLGITPSGLNASSDGEIRVFFDTVMAQQIRLYEPHMRFILELIMQSVLGEVHEDISHHWEALWQLSEIELANVRSTNANTAKTYIDAGVLDPQEERERLATEEDGLYQGLDPDDMPAPVEADEQLGIDPETGLPIDPQNDPQNDNLDPLQNDMQPKDSQDDGPDDVGRRAKVAKDAKFEEDKHPRDKIGEFSKKNSGTQAKQSESVSKSHTDTPEFKNWFGDSKVVDKEGKPLVVYHGTARPDRIDNRFRKNRATSGPMAFFADDPKMASSYAENKSDTSLETPDDYSGWFKIKPKGMRTEVPIDRAWNFLDYAQRQEIARLAPRVTQDDDGNIHLGPEDHKSGLGGYDYHIIEAKGNALKALVEEWLNSANLFNNEEKFIDVLRTAGLKDSSLKFDSPNASAPFVYATYLKIENPLDTSSIPPQVVADLEKAARRAPKAVQYGADPWDKRAVNPQEWIQRFRDDLKTGTNSHAWTSIPDWVTKVLQKHGYDGIKDIGGKNGGYGYSVWIPFDDHQVKSAIGNKGTFNSKSPLIGDKQIDFEESKHPRDKLGEFAAKAGGSGKFATKPGVASGVVAGTLSKSAPRRAAGRSKATARQSGAAKAEPAPSEPESGSRGKHQLTATAVKDGQRTLADGSALPEHIASLKIPPAWTDVKISSNADSPLLVQGRDAKGRVQSIYNKSFSETNAAAKFQRVNELAAQFDTILQRNLAAQKSNDQKTKDTAECLDLIMRMGVRPGSEEDTGADKKAYGATTLLGKHVVTFQNGKTFLRFTGKKGVSLNLPVDDAELAKRLQERAKQAGNNGQLFPNVTEKTLLDHVKEVSGSTEFKSKDFRTHLGTKIASETIAKIAAPTPGDMKAWKKAVKQVATVVSEKLGNTPTIALQSYINPTVFSMWGNPPK